MARNPNVLPEWYITVCKKQNVGLCWNVNLTINFINDHPYFPWSWSWLCGNHNFLKTVTLDDLVKHLRNEDWRHVCHLPIVTLQFIEHTKHTINWDWYYVSRNPNLTLQFVEQHFNKCVDNDDNNCISWEDIARNPGIAVGDLFTYIMNNIPYYEVQWQLAISALCQHPGLTLDFVLDNLNTSVVGYDDNGDEQKKTVTVPWDWKLLSRNPAVATLDNITNNHHLPWIWYWVAWNPNITEQFIEDNINEDWDWNYLAGVAGVNYQLFIRHPDQDWTHKMLSLNPTLSIDYVTQNPNLEWDWSALCRNSFNKQSTHVTV